MLEQIIDLIKNVGFPIACCVVLFLQQNKLTSTLHEISNTMTKITTRLDDIEDAVRGAGYGTKKE